MQFVWQDLIDRARTYVDDDHNDVKGALLTPARWLTIGQVEYTQQYRKWVRLNLVRPKPTETQFVTSTTLSGVLSIVGVGEDMGNYVRMLMPTQLTLGPDPWWMGSTPWQGMATEFAAHGTADNLEVDLYPQDLTNTYTIRWIPTVPYTTDPTQTVDIPYGEDERLVLGMARRAMVKESARSRLVEDLIQAADAEMTFTAWGRIAGGPKARRVMMQDRNLPNQWNMFPVDQRRWLYF